MPPTKRTIPKECVVKCWEVLKDKLIRIGYSVQNLEMPNIQAEVFLFFSEYIDQHEKCCREGMLIDDLDEYGQKIDPRMTGGFIACSDRENPATSLYGIYLLVGYEKGFCHELKHVFEFLLHLNGRTITKDARLCDLD